MTLVNPDIAATFDEAYHGQQSGKAVYRTFMSGKWHLAPDPTKHGFEQFYGTCRRKRFLIRTTSCLPRDQTARLTLKDRFTVLMR